MGRAAIFNGHLNDQMGTDMAIENEVFEYQKKILEHHLDTFGHVNNATYLEIFEEARWDFLTLGGFGMSRIQKEKVGPVILDISMSLKKEILNRENIIIKSQMKEVKNKYVFSMWQGMYKEGGILASEIILSFGVMDLEKRKLMVPSKEWWQVIGMNTK